MAASDDDPLSMLSPAQRAYLRGGTQQQQGTPASTPPATPAPPAAQPVSSPSGAPPTDTMPDPFGLRAAVRGPATAFLGGMYDVGSNIYRNLGGRPNQLPSDAQAAEAAHPIITGAGNLAGGALVAAPIGIAGGLAAAGAAPVIGTGLTAGVLTGAATGAAQNALAGNPDESLARRAFTGAGLGAAGGWLGNRIGRMFGSDATLASKGVQDAGKTAQAAGIDVMPGNLPQAGATAAQKGAAASPGQMQQINNAFGKVVGGDVSDFSAANLGPLTNRVGSEISTAVNQGQVQMTPTLESELQTVLQNAHAPGIDPLVTAKIEAEVDKVLSIAPNMGDTVAGTQFDRLVGAGSRLSRYTGDANGDLSDLARQLDTTLDRGFQASSRPGVYDQYVDAKTRYRMLKAIEDNVEGDAAGNIKPGTIMGDINRRFPDMPTQTGPGTVGQASDLARAVTTLFGGSGGPPGAAAATGGWISRHPGLAILGAGGVGGGATDIYRAVTDPAALGNALSWGAAHIPTGGAVLAATLAQQALRRGGAAYQQSQAFANALLQRGTQQAGNPLSAYVGAAAPGVLPPDRQSRRP